MWGEITARFFLPEYCPDGLKEAAHLEGLHPLIKPFERISVPEGLSGKDGLNRAPSVGCALEAQVDREALKAWLLARAPNPNTYFAYRREIERFWLWCLLERECALSSIRANDAALYLNWLENLGRTETSFWKEKWRIPQAQWLGPKNTPRSSQAWKPFNGPLAATSRRMAIVIVRQCFNFLKKTGYLIFNPFDQVNTKVPLLPGEGIPKEFADRSLTEDQWQALVDGLHLLPEGWPRERMKLLFMLGKSLGMRASEIARAKTGWIALRRLGLKHQCFMEIVGKGGKVRRLPLNTEQLGILNDALASRGLPEVFHCDPETDLVVNLNRGTKPGAALSRSGIWKVLTQYFELVANDLATRSPQDAAKLRAASTHWLRHTFAVNALSKMSVNIVQVAMGHASVATTGRYLNPDEEVITEAMKDIDVL